MGLNQLFFSFQIFVKLRFPYYKIQKCNFMMLEKPKRTDFEDDEDSYDDEYDDYDDDY